MRLTANAGTAIFLGLAAVITLAIALFAPLVHAQQPQGYFGQGHTDLHPWYRDLAQPGSYKGSCCSDRDCRPTQWRQGKTAVEVQIEGKWCPIPQERILPVEAPDGGAHICTGPIPAGADPCQATVFCVVIGFGS